jgi:hypothetical protein
MPLHQVRRAATRGRRCGHVQASAYCVPRRGRVAHRHDPGEEFLAFVVKGTAGVINNPELATDVRMAGLAAAVFASLVGLAAAALATVSLSIGFGQITGDPGIRDGQELLPQLGYVVIAVPAALSAALAIWFTASVNARSSALPGWIVAAGYVVAAAQLLSFYTLPLILLPLWVLAASFGLRKPR